MIQTIIASNCAIKQHAIGFGLTYVHVIMDKFRTLNDY
jgi:hypothetical protein